jgi:hypothetical protein
MARKRISKKPICDIFGNIEGFEAPEKDIAIKVCQKAEADEIIIQHHYSHKVTQNSFLSFLVYYKGKVNGALQLGYGIRPKIKKVGDNTDTTREFDRMWLSDEMPKFSETITLSLLHHFLRKVHPEVKTLISYADTSAGNKGTIYKAANYRLDAKLKADFYILENGERVHPVTMWHRHGTRAWNFLQKQYPNIRKADGYQLRYVFDL